MDKILDPDKRSWISDPIHIGRHMAALFEKAIKLDLLRPFHTGDDSVAAVAVAGPSSSAGGTVPKEEETIEEALKKIYATRLNQDEDPSIFFDLKAQEKAAKEKRKNEKRERKSKNAQQQEDEDESTEDDESSSEETMDLDLSSTASVVAKGRKRKRHYPSVSSLYGESPLDLRNSHHFRQNLSFNQSELEAELAFLEIDDDEDDDEDDEEEEENDEDEIIDRIEVTSSEDEAENDDENDDYRKQDIGNEQENIACIEALESQLKSLGVQSGPHRRLTGDSKFTPFMKRALEIKTERENHCAEKFKEQIMKSMGIDEETFLQLQAKTSVAQASVFGESFKEDPMFKGTAMPVIIPPIPDSDKLELKSMSILLCEANPTVPIWKSLGPHDQITEDLKYAAAEARSKQRREDYASGGLDLVDNTRDFLIEVSVYLGRSTENSLPDDIKCVEEPKLAYKIHLLGTNTVEDLYKLIHCNNDFNFPEVQHPDDVLDDSNILKHEDAPSMILIENVVYGRVINYAAAINAWAKTSSENEIGELEKGDASVQMKNLTVRLGFPYVYIHREICEHIIVFNIIRSLKCTDEHRIKEYPRIPNIPALKNVYCHVDNQRMATWAVLDCDDLPENPMFMCKKCLLDFCYTGQNKRMDFKLLPFRQIANEI